MELEAIWAFNDHKRGRNDGGVFKQLGESLDQGVEIFATIMITRPSVNFAKDWLDHSFPFPGLVWSEKEFYFGCDH